MTTNVPPVVFAPEGLVVPQESAILTGVQADFNDAFGGNLNPGLETPQGQLASSIAAIVADCNAQLALFVEQVNPDVADGFMQDAIARIYFLDRSPGVPTNVACVCSGGLGTVIPVGAEAQDTSGNRYVCTDGGVIPVSGSIILNFANVVDGPTPCPANTLTAIYRAIPGWDSIDNPAPGVLGRFVETRAEFEFRRENSVALNAHGSKEAIYAAVFDVEDVLDVYVTENVTDAVIPTGTTAFPVAAHSVYVAVVGGASADIANAIYTKKDLGCNMNGNTTVVVTDQSYTFPQPTYDITFERPDPLPIFFEVNIANNTALPADIVTLVQQAIIDAFTGADGSARIRIGGLILASKFVAPVSNIGPEVSILSLFVGTAGPANLTNLTAGIDQVPTVDAANIDVNII